MQGDSDNMTASRPSFRRCPSFLLEMRYKDGQPVETQPACADHVEGGTREEKAQGKGGRDATIPKRNA